MLYYGAPYQRGYGLGGTFRKFFSWIVPIFKKHALPVLNDGLKEVGKTALTTAADIAKDTVNGINIRDSFRERTNTALDTLKEKAEKKLEGRGYRINKNKKKTYEGSHSLSIKRGKKLKKKIILIKKRKDLKDIFAKNESF